MEITKLRLVGYKRLMLNNINDITITPQSLYQIIIGRNGSGKSSIIDELTPLPSAPANFNKGGGKTIELNDGVAKYVLTSTFKGENKHSFKRIVAEQEEELNPGGTGAVQRELVKRYFRITPEIHDLLTGRTLFTRMTPSMRREWITALSDTDLTYAIALHKKLRTSLRDRQGAFKHVSGRLVTETSHLENFKDVDSLLSDVKQVEEELIALMEERVSGSPTYQQVKTSLEINLGQLQSSSERLLKLNLSNDTGVELNSRSELEERLRKEQSEKEVIGNLLERATDEHQTLVQLMEKLENIENMEDADTLNERKEKLLAQIKQLSKGIRLFHIEDPDTRVNDTSEALPQVSELLMDLEDNSDKKYRRERITESKNKEEALTVSLDRAKHELMRVDNKISHILTAKETNCPKCGYTWKDGVSERDLEKLQSRAKELNALITQSTEELAKLSEYHEGLNVWLYNVRRFRDLVSGYPRLKALWDKIIEDGFPNANPRSHLAVLQTWEADLELSREISNVQTHLERTDAALVAINDSRGGEHIASRFAKLETEIQDLNDRKIQNARLLDRLRDFSNRVTEAETLYSELKALAQTIITERDTAIETLRQEDITYCINDHQAYLGQVKTRISEKETLDTLLKDLKDSADDLAIDVEAFKLLTAELSPQDGLIAEQLKGFIGSLVEQMNEIIAQVWTYDLQLQPCGMTSGDLDYRFPVLVRDENQYAPDVSRVSEGQEEIINFAFKIIVCLYLDFMNYPLYLDELGRTFDEQHRINVVNYIKMLVDSKRFSQVFYISHFACSYGAMSGADVLVLDGANIAVPANHNKHVIIK